MAAENSTDAISNFRSERDRFVAFAFAAAQLLIEVGHDERIVYAAGAARALTGRDASTLVGGLFRELFAEAQRGFAVSLLRQVRRDGRMAPVIVTLDRAGGPAASVVLNGCYLPEKGDTLYFTVAARLDPPNPADTAPRDEATGLLDRTAFQAAAVAALGGAPARGRDAELTLLEIPEMDALRARSGDRAVSDLLGEIGDFLRAHAVDRASAGRIAPDRFAVVRDSAQAAGLRAGIEQLSQAHDRAGRGLRVAEQTVPLAPGELSPADAEKALVYALGRFAAGGETASIRSLADGFRSLVADTVGRISRLRSSVNEDRLAIVFQPVVDLAGRRMHHYEVLSRFEGNRSPAEMIQFAEGIGMIEELDLAVCQRVLAFMDGSRENPDLKLAVNLSGRSLRSDVFVGALGGLLERRSDRSRLLFEITETAEIGDLARADRILQDLRRAGHKICLDDFGAGAASFPYLQALTVDFVKIDGAYIGRMLEATRDFAILKGMVTMCRDLDTAVIAEMIETEAQAERLAQIGVEFGQGFLFGRPAATPAAIARTAPKVPPKTKIFARRQGFVQRWG